MQCVLLGTGRQAGRLVSAIVTNNCQIRFLYSRSKSHAKRFVRDHNLLSTIISNDYRQCLQDPHVEAVIIATPDYLHYEQAKAALDAGKHVFLEKPLATNVQHAIELESLAQEQGLTLAVDYHLRWNPALIFLFDLIQNGKFGCIARASIKWGWLPGKFDDWRNKENPFWALSLLGTHCIDLVLWLFQSIYGPVDSFIGMKHNSIYRLQNEDHVQLQFQFSKKLTVEVECTLERMCPLTIEISSETGQYTFDKLMGEDQEISFQGEKHTFETKNPWSLAFNDFKIAVKNKIKTKVNLEDALSNVFYLTEVQKSPDFYYPKPRARPSFV